MFKYDDVGENMLNRKNRQIGTFRIAKINQVTPLDRSRYVDRWI